MGTFVKKIEGMAQVVQKWGAPSPCVATKIACSGGGGRQHREPRMPFHIEEGISRLYSPPQMAMDPHGNHNNTCELKCKKKSCLDRG